MPVSSIVIVMDSHQRLNVSTPCLIQPVWNCFMKMRSSGHCLHDILPHLSIIACLKNCKFLFKLSLMHTRLMCI